MNASSKKSKVCLVATRGGHLAQLLTLEDAYNDRGHFLITTRGHGQETELARFSRIFFVTDINEWRWLNPLKLAACLFQTFRIFRAERPGFLISTGSGVAAPAFFWALLLGTKSIFVEDCARVRTISRTGRICYPVADLFFVQHGNLCAKYPQAIYAGALYKNFNSNE